MLPEGYTVVKQYISGVKPDANTCFDRHIAEVGYDRNSLYHQRMFWEWYVSTRWYYENMPHWEWFVRNPEGQTVAAICFEEKHDFEAGRSIAMINAFNSEPETISLAPGYRFMFKTAKQYNVGTVIHSRRIEDGISARYETVFTKVGGVRFGKR